MATPSKAKIPYSNHEKDGVLSLSCVVVRSRNCVSSFSGAYSGSVSFFLNSDRIRSMAPEFLGRDSVSVSASFVENILIAIVEASVVQLLRSSRKVSWEVKRRRRRRCRGVERNRTLLTRQSTPTASCKHDFPRRVTLFVLEGAGWRVGIVGYNESAKGSFVHVIRDKERLTRPAPARQRTSASGALPTTPVVQQRYAGNCGYKASEV